MDGTRSVGRACALAVLAVGLRAAAAGELPARTQTWIRVDTASAVVLSNAGEAKATEIARRLEQFRAVLYQRLLSVEPSAAVPVVVYAFRNETSLNRYKPAQARAYFRETDLEKLLVLNASPAAVMTMKKEVQHSNPYAHFPYHDVYHEYSHFVLSTAVPGAPSWLDEGMAQFLGTFQVRKDEVEIGRVGLQFAAPLEWGRWMDFDKLLSVRQVHGHVEEVALFYAESWALVHYLMLNPAAKGKLNAFVGALRAGATHEQAFAESFASGPAELQAAVHEHITAQRLPFVSLPLEGLEVPVEQRVTPMTHAEVLCRLGELLMPDRGHEAGEDAERHFRAAIEEAPEYGPGWNGLARVLDSRGQIEDAAAHHRKAAALDPASYRHQIDFGRNCLARLEVMAGAGLRDEARGAFATAVKLQPRLGEPYAAFGSSYLYDPQYVPGGEAALRKAWNLLPWRMDIPLTMMLLHLKRGDPAAATAVAEQALGLGPARFLALLAAEAARKSSYAEQVRAACRLVGELRSDASRAALWTRIEADPQAREALATLLEHGSTVHEAAPP